MTQTQIEHQGAITVLTMNRPEKLNALDASVLAELATRLDEIDARTETRCALITGAGKAFVAGADIASMQGLDEVAATRFANQGQAVFAKIEALRCPVIAAVNGFALGGGCELALACDFIIASERATFGQPEVKLGVIPGFGGTQRLSRRVGVGLARELCYSGRMVKAAEAQAIGLVNRVVPPDALLAECMTLANDISQVGPLAVTAAKRTILAGEGLPLSEANDAEAKAFGKLFGSRDQSEGMAAFLEKRTPSFTGE